MDEQFYLWGGKTWELELKLPLRCRRTHIPTTAHFTEHSPCARCNAECLRCSTCEVAVPHSIYFTDGEVRPQELKPHQATGS